MRTYNPFLFLPMPVTVLAVVIYFSILIPILVVHETVPPAPSNPTLYRGLNLTSAWLDLNELSNGYHPFISRRNDEVRDWLLRRIANILEENGVEYKTETIANSARAKQTEERSSTFAEPVHTPHTDNYEGPDLHADIRARSSEPAAIIFNDIASNYTSTAPTNIGVDGRRLGISTYFEGNNIIVYIRGKDDEEGEWWNSKSESHNKIHGRGGVMVNAHFDSVSTGYGATDDGMGVVTTLQLIRYFTTPENKPKKGFVALLNNGEEDGLLGAKAFLPHPLSSFVHTFLNLEGAGAGGRAILFRSTDTEVSRAYGHAKHPFGTVVTADVYSLGFIRSETDFVIWREEGYRGLDVAFWKPRSKYHTNEDDAKHASVASLWHMLSASVETVKVLTSDTSDTFVGPRGDNAPGKVENGKGTVGVWFDLFGRAFAVFELHSLFAWSLSLLIASPLILFLTSYLLIRQDKYFFFAGTVKPEGESISMNGWRGVFRFPIAFIVSSALTLGGAFLLHKLNPLIIYSSQYSVWAMSLCLYFSVFWFIMAGCNFVRPSALHRAYVFIWLFSLGWLLLIGVTVFEDRFRIGGGYIFVIFETVLFLATFISFCELFALPTKASVVQAIQEQHENREDFNEISEPHFHGTTNVDGNNDHDEQPDETTPLIRGSEDGHRTLVGRSFADTYRKSMASIRGNNRHGHSRESSSGHLHESHKAYGLEQTWSAKLPTWTWTLQFLVIGPFTLVIFAQVGLLVVSAIAQTGADGNALLQPYLLVAIFSILILLPLAPFIHRITHHIPTFLFLIFIGTLIYNLVAFPFSTNNRYKAYFQQTVDLDTGLNRVTLVGIEEYIRTIISSIPSAAGQTIGCSTNPKVRSGLSFCSWEGLSPKVADNVRDGIPPEKRFGDWLTYNVTRVSGKNKATFSISGIETRACVLRFDDPINTFKVQGAANNDGEDVPESGSDQIMLWHRDFMESEREKKAEVEE
ncbi:hypothetical protein B7494_g4101 [Chlorociboria aeruginascens]|nr:hypothetical protein B7494_g4101 [Chlorociboria aeruginascens]